MQILLVSPFPPARDGIASYAVQQVTALRREGHRVEVLSPGPSAAQHHLDLVGARGALALARRVRGYDKVVVQFHPDYFYPIPCTDAERARISAALEIAFRAARQTEVWLHEIDYRHGRGRTPGAVATRRMWRAVDRILFHTESERSAFVEAFAVRPERTAVVPHGASFVRYTSMGRDRARTTLGVDPDAHVFLAIGFVQPHKGFDRAVRAFRGLADTGARLYIVGSVRFDDPAVAGYVGDLRDLVAATPGVELLEGYVSDELFDRWIVAADTVVLPYRNIWSSGVMERAALYGRPVIATAVGGLSEQAAGRAVELVADDAGLRAAMAAALGLPAAATAPWPDPADLPSGELRAGLQREVARRARLRRGGAVPATERAEPGRRTGPGARGDLSAPVRRIPSYQVPAAVSGRPGAAALKRLVRRLTAWQVDPLADYTRAVHQQTVRALERVADELDRERPS